jgi:ABC-type dipeptide/oligopeptide/nickel transport system permease subunit
VAYEKNTLHSSQPCAHRIRDFFLKPSETEIAGFNMNFWETFYKNKLTLSGGGLVILLLVISILAQWLAPYDPGQINLNNVLASPSAKHLFGTDQLGRDVLSRMIWGARISLIVGFVATGIAIIIGAILGAVSGYYGGWVDSVILSGAFHLEYYDRYRTDKLDGCDKAGAC